MENNKDLTTILAWLYDKNQPFKQNTNTMPQSIYEKDFANFKIIWNKIMSYFNYFPFFIQRFLLLNEKYLSKIKTFNDFQTFFTPNIATLHFGLSLPYTHLSYELLNDLFSLLNLYNYWFILNVSYYTNNEFKNNELYNYLFQDTNKLIQEKTFVDWANEYELKTLKDQQKQLYRSKKIQDMLVNTKAKLQVPVKQLEARIGNVYALHTEIANKLMKSYEKKV